MYMERITHIRISQNGTTTNVFFYLFEYLFIFIGPMKRSIVMCQLIQRLAIYSQIFYILTIPPKTANYSRYVSFIFTSFPVFQIVDSFGIRLYPLVCDDVSQKFYFLYEEKCFFFQEKLLILQFAPKNDIFELFGIILSL